MDNNQKTKNSHYFFSWDKLGDIDDGRRHLGNDMPVFLYRLMEYSVNHVLYERYGETGAIEVFREAGLLAGKEMAQNMLPLDVSPSEYITAVQKLFLNHKIGIMRLEEADFENELYTFTVHEDLDCSGLPPTGEIVCSYDEGLLAGILECYAGKPFHVREVECWAHGDRVCKFRGKPLEDDSLGE